MRDAPGLDERFLAAIERLSQARRAATQERATRWGLSPLQLDLLTLLDVQAAENPGASALAKELDVTVPTVADAVVTLIRKGLVRDAPHPGDGRRKVVSLTGKGRRRVREITDDTGPLTDAVADLPPTDKAATLAVLVELIGELHRSGVLSRDRSCATCRFRRTHGGSAGSCALLGVPLDHADLRIDCPEHEPIAASA